MNRNTIVETYYRENYGALIKIARCRVGDYSLPLAEEAVQEAFERALRYFRSYKQVDDFNKWFRTILNNTINQIKKQERDKGRTTSLELDDTNMEDVSREFTYPDQMISILNTMSKRDATIVNLYFFHGFTSKEVGEYVNVSDTLVRQIIYIFRRKVDKSV